MEKSISTKTLDHSELDSPHEVITRKNSQLLSRISLFLSVLAFASGIFSLSEGLYMACYIDLTSACALLISYFLNRKRKHLAARLLFLLILNLMFIVFCYSYPLGTGLYLLFIPVICMTSLLFGSENTWLKYVFVLLPIAGLILVFTVPVTFIPMNLLTEPQIRQSLIFNLSVSVSIVVFSLHWMVKLTAQTEDWLSNMIEKSIHKNIELEAANEELDKFLYRTTHDLRSPLASMKGLVMMTAEETNDPQVQEFLSEIVKSIERMDSFSKEIIEYSKNALTEVFPESVDLKQLTTDVIDSLKYMKEATPIEFIVHVGTHQNLLIDKRRLRIVLHNLIANAIKYHDLEKPLPFIKIDISRTQKEVMISVQDNGSGIDPEFLPRIFDMFYRATTTSTGSGLGLYIVKEALEKMKGEIKVETKLGEGSRFDVRIPAGGVL